MNERQLRQLIDNPALRAHVTSTQVTEALLARIETLQPATNNFITVTAARALEDARRADLARKRGHPLPLDGLPVAIKDNIDVRGVRTTMASRFFLNRVARTDAEVVRKLRRAGAIVVGKSNLHELASGVTTQNPPPFGNCRNPWDLDRIPGGSSGGSGAALMADECFGALGTDTGGSVRIPAALNGVVGLRPTYGSVSTRGTFPICWSFDTVGPMARRADDVLRLFNVITGYDARDPRSVQGSRRYEGRAGQTTVAGLRIGLAEDFFFDDLDPDVERSVRDAVHVLAELGAEVRPVDLNWGRELSEAASEIMRCESLAIHRVRFDTRPDWFGAALRDRLELADTSLGWKLAANMDRILRWRQSIIKLFESVDVIACPTTKVPAPLASDADSAANTWNVSCLAIPWACAKTPAISAPCGMSENGLPVGLQLAGPPWSEELLLNVITDYQSVTHWHRLRPSQIGESITRGASTKL